MATRTLGFFSAILFFAPTAAQTEACGELIEDYKEHHPEIYDASAPANDAGGQGTIDAGSPPKPNGSLVLRVKGDKFVDGDGNVIQLRGVNRPGLEYGCSQMNQFISDPWSAGNNGTNDGKTLAYADKVASSLLSWDKAGAPGHAINTVRVPLNEECWLGINGAPAAFSGANYQAFVKRLVDNLTKQGMYVVLVNHWSGAGTWLPGRDKDGKVINGQNVAPNADHAFDFWTSIASQYKSYTNIMFDVFTEPSIQCSDSSDVTADCPQSVINAGYYAQDAWAWNLYLKGGYFTYGQRFNQPGYETWKSRVGVRFKVAGTQEITDTIRATGSTAPIAIEALGGGSGYVDMMGSHLPIDPLKSIVASTHSYSFGGFKTSADGLPNYDATLASGKGPNPDSPSGPQYAINGRFPFYLGEYGQTQCPINAVGHEFTKSTMDWLDKHQYAGTAWGWDEGEGCYGPSLVAKGGGDDTGAVTEFGADVKAHLQSLQK